MTNPNGLLLPGPKIREVFDETDFLAIDRYENLLEGLDEDVKQGSGVADAARLLLSETAVAIQFIDTSKPAEWVPHLYPPSYARKIQLGFNDHGGGSESHYRILLNRHAESGAIDQYVLYSPPNDTGGPASTTFHRASFTFPMMEPSGLEYEEYLPNALKTSGAASMIGRHYYNFYLFGNEATPATFSEVFERIGFAFDDQPYSYDEMRDLKAQASQNKSKINEWPGGQFAAEIAKL